MMRSTNQQNSSGPHGHSNAELVSNATASLPPPPPAHHLAGNSNPHHLAGNSNPHNLAGNSNHHHHQHDIPLASNSTHLTVPSHNHSAIIQIKDSEII